MTCMFPSSLGRGFGRRTACERIADRVRLTIGGCLVMTVFACSAGAQTLAETSDSIRVNLLALMPHPDAIMDGLDSDSAELRCLAIRRLRDWHVHVPGTLELLRRSVHDKDAEVAVTAVETAAEIGSVGAFQAVLGILDRDLSTPDRADVVDALDARSFRPHWRWSDRFGARDRIEVWKKQSSRSFEVEQLLRLKIPEPSLQVTRVGRESMQRAQCYDCHRLSGYGRERGPSLDNIGECFSAEDLVRHIHQPSLEIHDMGRTLQIVTSNGTFLTGQPTPNSEPTPDMGSGRNWMKLLTRMRSQEVGSIIPSTLLGLDGVLVLRDHWSDSDRDYRVSRDDIESVRVSPTSPMPEKLLDKLTPTEVADLLAFVLSNGGCDAKLPSTHHH